jgi:hypothetical protein
MVGGDLENSYPGVPSMPSPAKNGFKTFENMVLEGTFKLKKVFFVRNQIPISRQEDEFGQFVMGDKKTELIPPKMDFNIEVPFKNQVLSYHRMLAFIEVPRDDQLGVNGESIHKKVSTNQSEYASPHHTSSSFPFAKRES